MAKIHILPEHLSNKIAAGEVVERPASVVKELVENSLDAGATRIEIEIEGGGTRLIRIIDDGEGMDEDDVLLSLERHGTSKITTDQDLDAISTLGFRGEAIPSISAVAKMTIISRHRNQPLGTRVEINYGKMVKVHEAGCSIGTTIEIRNLFGNTPARRKFLRTTRTELNHVEEVVKNYALAEPQRSFLLTVNGKKILHLDAGQPLAERLGTVMNYNGDFLAISEEKSHLPFVNGYLIPPEKLHNGPARLRLLVNKRAVKDRLMMHAAVEGLRGFLMKGKNPSGLLHLHLSPEEVDVNVHPAKQEVRFRDGHTIHFLISSTIARAMHNEQRRLQATLFGQTQPQTPRPVDDTSYDFSHEERDITSPLTTQETAQITPQPVASQSSFQEPPPQRFETETRQPWPQDEIEKPKTPAFTQSVPVQPKQEPASLLPKATVSHSLQVIGQFDNLYIFCQSLHGLVVIDQHAAHERLLFEKLKNQFANRSVSSQQLLFPETVELSPFQAQLVEKHLEELIQIGFSLREFGGGSYIISAIPALVSKANPAELFMDVLEQFGTERTKRDNADIIDTILATMACRAAVKAGTALGHQEIEALLDAMAKADLFSHCPHGRPVVKQFTPDEIKKWFHRT